jgi:hypothetical protein
MDAVELDHMNVVIEAANSSDYASNTIGEHCIHLRPGFV